MDQEAEAIVQEAMNLAVAIAQELMEAMGQLEAEDIALVLVEATVQEVPQGMELKILTAEILATAAESMMKACMVAGGRNIVVPVMDRIDNDHTKLFLFSSIFLKTRTQCKALPFSTRKIKCCF